MSTSKPKLRKPTQPIIPDWLAAGPHWTESRDWRDFKLDWVEFRKRFSESARYNQWDAATQLLRLQWVLAAEDSCQNIDYVGYLRYPEHLAVGRCMAACRAKLAPPESAKQYNVDRFFMARQNKSESHALFRNRIFTMYTKAYSIVPTLSTESAVPLVQGFIMGLRDPYLAYFVFNQRPSTLSAASTIITGLLANPDQMALMRTIYDQQVTIELEQVQEGEASGNEAEAMEDTQGTARSTRNPKPRYNAPSEDEAAEDQPPPKRPCRERRRNRAKGYSDFGKQTAVARQHASQRTAHKRKGYNFRRSRNISQRRWVCNGDEVIHTVLPQALGHPPAARDQGEGRPKPPQPYPQVIGFDVPARLCPQCGQTGTQCICQADDSPLLRAQLTRPLGAIGNLTAAVEHSPESSPTPPQLDTDEEQERATLPPPAVMWPSTEWTATSTTTSGSHLWTDTVAMAPATPTEWESTEVQTPGMPEANSLTIGSPGQEWAANSHHLPVGQMGHVTSPTGQMGYVNYVNSTPNPTTVMVVNSAMTICPVCGQNTAVCHCQPVVTIANNPVHYHPHPPQYHYANYGNNNYGNDNVYNGDNGAYYNVSFGNPPQ